MVIEKCSKQQARREALLFLIEEAEEIEAESLAFSLGVSEATLRADLKALGLSLPGLRKQREKKLDELSREIYGKSLAEMLEQRGDID